MQETLFNYQKVYLVLSFIGNRREKESMEAELIESDRQREATYHGEKERARQKPWIFNRIFNMLFCKTKRKIGLVNFSLLTSSRLVFTCVFPSSCLAVNSPKDPSRPLSSIWFLNERNIRFRRFYTCVQKCLCHPVFPCHFWPQQDLWPDRSKTVCFLIHFFFNFSFLRDVQLRYNFKSQCFNWYGHILERQK